ncbi:MAG: hypothetical protein KDA91_15005 [Planctomycetaceae bacterium]|nr:hypothetical protein [Planctomycetaceae bacterium]
MPDDELNELLRNASQPFRAPNEVPLTSTPSKDGPIEVPSVHVLPSTSSTMPRVRSQPVKPDSGQVASSDSDALRILLQASAAAESLQKRFTELNQQRSEIAAEHQQLAADRRAFESRAREFAEQVARDRTAQRELQAELDQRIARVATQEEQLERQTADLRAAQRALSEERVLLKQSVKAELAEQQSQLEQQMKLVETERQRVLEQNEKDRLEHAERMKQLDAELQSERDRLLEKVRKEVSSELAQLNREKQEWATQREAHRLEMQQQQEDLQQQREVFGEQLETEQTRLREEVEKRRQMLLTEQSNLQRRYRFQFEHLGRAREDLEFEVRELRREQQLFRTERHRFTELHRLRFHQLEQVRRTLAATEASLARDTRIVERSRTAALADIQKQQRRAEEERDALNQDTENRLRRVRQQEVNLAELATQLEERSQRLSRLRSELDRTQGEILEQRLAVEEARESLFRDSSLGETARIRLEQARGDVQSFFDRMKSQINSERDKVESLSAEVTNRQAQFRQDRAALEEWFLEREASLNARTSESVVEELQTTIQQQQAELSRLQDRWKADRREAERSIRELLDQLATIEMNAVRAMPPRGQATNLTESEDGQQTSGHEDHRDAA